MDNSPRAVTVAATARLLDLAIPTVYSMLADGRLTRFPVEGKTILVDRKSIKRWLDRQAVTGA